MRRRVALLPTPAPATPAPRGAPGGAAPPAAPQQLLLVTLHSADTPAAQQPRAAASLWPLEPGTVQLSPRPPRRAPHAGAATAPHAGAATHDEGGAAAASAAAEAAVAAAEGALAAAGAARRGVRRSGTWAVTAALAGVADVVELVSGRAGTAAPHGLEREGACTTQAEGCA